MSQIDEVAATRDIWSVANQLEGYVGPDTPNDLAEWLLREGKEAALLANRIVILSEALQTISEGPKFGLDEIGTDKVFLAYNDAVKLARDTLAIFPAAGG